MLSCVWWSLWCAVAMLFGLYLGVHLAVHPSMGKGVHLWRGGA